MSLPIFQSQSREMTMMQTKWASSLEPLLANPMSGGLYVSDTALVSGVNTIDHRLGRKPQGWIVTDINAAITIFRSAAFNSLTLTLTASGPATVTLYVF